MADITGPTPLRCGSGCAAEYVYAGTLTIGAAIARSEMGEAAVAQIEAESAGSVQFPVVDPDELAAHYWDMYVKRDRVEQFHPEALTPQAAA